MSGRLGHVARDRRIGHVPANGIRPTNYAYGFGGCLVWMEPDFGTNTQSNLAAVNSWKSRFNNFDFVQASAGNQPRFISSDPAYNNYPVVEFQDQNRFLRLTPTGNRIAGINTVAFVANYNNLNAGRNTLFGDIATINGNGVGLGGGTAGINGVFLRSSFLTTSGTTENTNVKIGVVSENLIMVNGVVENTSPNLFNFAFDSIGQMFNAGNAIDGKAALILAFNSVFTASQALQLSSNINSKYAIY